MDKRLIGKYLEYARSGEAYAVLFVKKYLERADGSVWVDILSYDDYDAGKLMFKSVECELFPRKTVPDHPDRSGFPDGRAYTEACRAATWEAAAHDIAMLRRRGYTGRKYRISGVSYPKDGGRRYGHSARPLPKPDPDRFFVDSAPPEIKALARNLNDRTDPLWEKAMRWISAEYGGPGGKALDPRLPGSDDDDDYAFRITRIERI